MLMLGGAYLCYEGAEKVFELVRPHAAPADAVAAPATVAGARREEDRRVRGAVRTDLILSAEIMAVTLGSVAGSPFWTRVFVLAAVGIGITGLVYGAVAVIVKADDVGIALARSGQPVARAIGRFIVRAMPYFLKVLGLVGTAAMLWVGGGIVLHGLEQYGWAAVAHGIEHTAELIGHALGAAGPATSWLVSAAAAGLIGLGLGAVIVPLAKLVTPAAAH